MKKKELVQLVIALVIIAIAGFLLFQQFGPKGEAKPLTYEKITPIEPDFNQEALRALNDGSKTKNFYTAPDLKSGVGNSSPFAPLR